MSRPSAGARRPPRPLFLVALVLVFVWLVVSDVIDAVREARPFTPREEEVDARFSIWLAAQAIEAYRDSAGVLPTSLESLGVDASGLTYQPFDDAYTLSVSAGSQTIRYRRGEDLAPFAQPMMQTAEE